MRAKLRALAVTSALLALLAFAACPRSRDRTVLVVGMDAATMTVMEPMVRKGELPTFARFWKEGAHGRLQTIEPTLSVIVWTSILTGARPEDHGIKGWLSESGEQLAFSSDRILRPPLWRILNARGLPTLFVNFWASWPAEVVSGGLVSNRMKLRELPYRATPPDLLAALDAVPLPPGKPEIGKDPANPLAGRLFYEDDRYVLALAKKAIPLVAPRVCAVYLRGLDIVQHNFWHTVDPAARRADGATAPDPPMVELYYRYLDGELARLMDAMPRATVVVVSDHGMEALGETPPLITGLNTNRLLDQMGYLALEPPGVKKGPRRAIVWASTKAYTFGDSAPDLDRGIRVNLAGREEHGIVSEGERAPLIEKLRSELAALTSSSGEKLFTAVTPVAGGGPDDADLKLDINPRISWEDSLAISERTVRVKELGVPALSHNSGQHWHAPPGVVLMMGPGVKSGIELSGATVFDIAPTVLSLVGLPAARDMAGKPLADALDFAPPAPVASYNDLPARIPGRGQPDNPEAVEKTLEDLKALNYIQP